MAYPTHLLPQSNYKKIDWRNELRQFFLVRSAPTRDFLDENTGQVRALYVCHQSEHLKDFSTNLFGIYTEHDSAVKIVKNENSAYFLDNWKQGVSVSVPEDADFEILADFGYFFYKIDTLQDFPIAFSIQKSDYLANCYVCHTPTNSNFWHFSARWKKGADDIELVLSVSQRKHLLGLVRSFLIENAILALPKSSIITEEYFII
jgi:hypothetical protein